MSNRRVAQLVPLVPLVRRSVLFGVPVAVLAFIAASWPLPTTATAGPQATVAVEAKQQTGSTVAEWSDRLWRAAMQGDLPGVEEALQSIPDSPALAEVEKMRASVADRSKHAETSRSDRTKELDQSLAELREQLDKGEITKALTAAVKLQTLSEDWKEPLKTDLFRELLTRAVEADRAAQESGDWLLAQEILFRLRTLHEDAGDRELFGRFNKALEQVNRRIGLMARYAPKQLYELRRLAAERTGQLEKFPAWNPAFADDWKEQERGITKPMLSGALKIAASEHISSGGWKPLLEGGLNALGIFATTEALGETFPGIADQTKVDGFLEAIARGKSRVEPLPAGRVDRSDYNSILADLLTTNDRTLQLPEVVVLHEFGDGAIEELASRFEDQYSEIIWPERLRRFQQQVDGDFVGVGILIRHDDKRDIMVINPLEGSPAARGGIKADDRIAAVNGMPSVGWSLNKAVDEITGPVGQPVTLSIKRSGVEEPFEVQLVRDRIKIRSVNGWWKRGLDANGAPEWDWWLDPSAGIGYVRLTAFNEESFEDFRSAIAQMRAERPLNGLVLDLRHNPGGLLKSAVDFTNIFVPGGEVVSGEDRDGRQVWKLEAQRNRADLAGLPVVVLVNQGSASASEIVSGALQVHDAAVVLGDRTFGKGSVQTVHDISDRNAGAAIKLTTQHYLLPAAPGETRGRVVHKKPGADDWGVKPDLTVKMTPEQIEKSITLRQEADIIEEWKDEADRKPRPDPKELFAQNLDPQLETALLILQARALKELDAAAMAAARR